MINLLWAFASIACGGMLFGYIIGINSNVVTTGQLLCSDDYTDAVGTWSSWGYRQCYNLSSAEVGTLSTLNLVGACASSIVCFRYADVFGRKLEVQLGALLYMAGAAIAAASPVLWGSAIGFLVYGLGIGFAMHAAPVYIAEIAPADVRGTLVSAKEAVIVLGMFLGFLSGFVFSPVDFYGWRYMLAVADGLALAMLAGTSSIPESPRFLVLRLVRGAGCSGRPEEEDLRARASTALRFYRRAPAQAVEEELESLIQDVRSSLEADGDGERRALNGGALTFREMLAVFDHGRPLAVGCGLVLLQQVTGQPSIMYFATNIFKDAGFRNSAALQSVIVGLVKLVATLFTVWRVEQFGRRALLFAGISIMAAALVILSTGFLFWACSVPTTAGAGQCRRSDMGLPRGWAGATVAALLLYVSGYQVGFGPITWLLISEIFPLRVRGSALSVAALVNFGSNIAVTMLQPLVMDAITPAGLFLIYLGLTVLSIAFVALLVPETKGLSLEAIEAQMRAAGSIYKSS